MLFFFRSLEFSLKYLCYVFASFNSFFQGTTALEWRTKNTPCIYISYGFYALRGWQSFLNSVTVVLADQEVPFHRWTELEKIMSKLITAVCIKFLIPINLLTPFFY